MNEFFSVSMRSSSPPLGRPRDVPRTTGLPSLSQPLRPISLTHEMLYPTLSPLPSAYARQNRRTRAADTDAGGRRAGGPEDADWDQKDALPAYDNVGGPPKYVELEMQNARTRLHLDLAGVTASDRVDFGRESLASGEDTPVRSHQGHLHSPSYDAPHMTAPPEARSRPHEQVTRDSEAPTLSTHIEDQTASQPPAAGRTV